MEYLYIPQDCGFSPNPYELRLEKSWSLDLLPQEYSGANTGDFRVSSLNLVAEDGIWGTDLRFVRYEILPGKYSVPGMPSAFDREGGAETLSITLRVPQAMWRLSCSTACMRNRTCSRELQSSPIPEQRLCG